MVAMRGNGCVAIASDLRFGVQAMTISKECSKVHEVPRMRGMVGLVGLHTDTKTVIDALRYHMNMHGLKEELQEHDPKDVARQLSSLQYSRRFGPWFVEPVVAGLRGPGLSQPYICSMDTIGCMNEAEDFVVAGTASDQLYGMCEALYREGLGPDDLFEVISQALLSACDRDALSGWGAVVHVMYNFIFILVH
mgnify:FL=1